MKYLKPISETGSLIAAIVAHNYEKRHITATFLLSFYEIGLSLWAVLLKRYASESQLSWLRRFSMVHGLVIGCCRKSSQGPMS
jgi:hypothetical protein